MSDEKKALIVGQEFTRSAVGMDGLRDACKSMHSLGNLEGNSVQAMAALSQTGPLGQVAGQVPTANAPTAQSGTLGALQNNPVK